MDSTNDKKLNPFIPAVASFFIMGLGQLINKNWLKALLWFLIPVAFFTIELTTSQWGKYIDIVGGRADEIIANQTINYIDADTYTTDYSDSEDGLLNDLLGLGGSFDEESFGDDEFAFAQNDLFSDILGVGTGGEADEEISLYSDDDGDESYSYFDAVYEYPNYAVSLSDEKYILRDFGGFFTQGLWGLFTLGSLVIDDQYAGKTIELYNKVTPWLTADNSTLMLGMGLIALISLSILVFFWILGIFDAYKTRKNLNKLGLIESFAQYAKRIWDDMYVYIMLAPAIVLVLFFTLIPFLYTFLIAFTNYTYKIKLGSALIDWIGFGSFGLAAFDPGWLSIFAQIFAWTIFWAVMSTFTVYGLGFLNALIVESPLVRGRKVWRMLLILPWAVPALIALIVFRQAFDKDGLINQFLYATGLMESFSNFLYMIGLQGQPDTPIFWFDPIYNGNLARACVIFVNLWLGAPYHMMMIIGVLATIPRELYEAADIDGASGWQRFKTITLPMVLASTLPPLIMTFAFNFNNFGAVYFLTGGGPLWDPTKVPETMRVIGSSMPGQTDILISWIYKLSFTKGTEQFNVAAVYSIFIFMIVGAFSVFNLLKTKAFNEDAGE